MPGRDDFDEEIFEGNPFWDLGAEEIFDRLRWGEAPTEKFEIDGPEDMATLGTVARIDYAGGVSEQWDEDEAPYLAVGAKSNAIYIVPNDGGPLDVPSGPYEPVEEATRLDYYASKGGEVAYYTHDHEPPYPTVYENPKSGVRIVVPADNEGARSYAVDEEGIIG